MDGAPAIRTYQLTKRFGAVRAVDGIDLEVPQGSVFGLIGPNGAGKTTTFGLVCGWVRPTSGTAEVLGLRPGTVSELKGRLSALPQDAALPPNTSVLSSLTYYGRLQGLDRGEARREAERVLDLVGLAQWGKVRAMALSHGMAKRVGLAQAFLGRPELVLLDEPTAGLDPKSAHHIRETIRELKGQATVVVSSHNLFELEALCDRAAIIDHGRIVAQDAMQALTTADTEVVIELVDPPERHAAIVHAAEAVEAVSSASMDAARGELVVRFAASEGGPADVITAVLAALIQAGAHVAGVHRGRGLEQKVLSLG